MQTISLETWEVAYNEDTNELRLLLSTSGKDSHLVVLDENMIAEIGVTDSLEVALLAQPISPRDVNIDDEDDDDYGVEDGAYYRLGDADLSGYFTADKEKIVLTFNDDVDRSMLESSIWDMSYVFDYAFL